MKKLVSIVLAAVMCLGVGACGSRKKVADTPETLEIFVANFGYGTAWLQPMIDAFLEEDWVKEKYPNLVIPAPSSNSERNYGADRTLAGPVNTIDLFITCATPVTSLNQEYRPGQKYFEKLDDLFATQVPGENITFGDKLLPEFHDSALYEERDGSQGYYCVPWVTGYLGLLYNKTQFDALELELPNTTDELIALCDEIVDKGKTPFTFSSSYDYWTSFVALAWWAQYQGIDEYNHYYSGEVPTGFDGVYTRSKEVVKQEGRFEALTVMENLIGTKGQAQKNKYVADNVNTMSFTQAQADFLLGRGLMTPNGDWFETEMRETAEEGVTDTFTFMRTPVISAIIKNLPDSSIETDAELSAVIDAIDADLDKNGGDVDEGYTAAKAAVAELTEDDYQKVREARRTIFREPGHSAYIPSYATAKEPAKDFLLFMATDKANNIFIKNTYGASMPFKYDVEKEDPELFNSLASLHRQRLKYTKQGIFTGDYNCQRMLYFGGLGTFVTVSGSNVAPVFTTLNPAEYKTAADIYQGEIDHWNDQRWDYALTTAGYKN